MKKSTVSRPRPPLQTVGAGLSLLVPTMFLLVMTIVCFLYLLIAPGPNTEGQYAICIGFGRLSLPSSWMVWTLFQAFCRQSERAAKALSVVCVFLTLLSVPGWIVGLLNLSGILHNTHGWESWWELMIYSLVILTFAFIGFAYAGAGSKSSRRRSRPGCSMT